MVKKQKNTTKHGALVGLERCLEEIAGKSVASSVMKGSEDITERTDRIRIALWVKSAMQRLEESTDEKTRTQVMRNCGYNCAIANNRIISRALERRSKYASLDDFIKAETRKPMKGTRLVWDGSVLYLIYIPQTFTRPMRCFCALTSDLPSIETMSLTYCNCGKGFVEKYWEAVLERPVKVEILESAISGSSECKFAIHV